MDEEIPLKDSLEWLCSSGISIYLKQLWGAGLCSPSLRCCWGAAVGLGTPGCAVKHKILSGLWNLGPNYSCLKTSLAKMLQHWVRYQTALPVPLSLCLQWLKCHQAGDPGTYCGSRCFTSPRTSSAQSLEYQIFCIYVMIVGKYPLVFIL